MQIAIIGAGFTGLAAASKLTQSGHQVTIFESGSQPGGLAASIKLPGWDWPLETYYHHIFTSDYHIQKLASLVGTRYFFNRPITANYYQGHGYQFDSPRTLLKFPHLTWLQKARVAATVAAFKLTPIWRPLEGFTAEELLTRTLGLSAYQKTWQPLMIAKFGPYTKDLSAAWFWARIKKRSIRLGYFQGGFQALADATAESIRSQGGEILFNTSVTRIAPLKSGHIQLTYSTTKSKIQNTKYDACLVTLSSSAFLKLTPDLPQNYQTQLTQLHYLGSQILLLRLKQPFFSDHTYWLSILDKDFPFLAVVEHTNFISPSHYDNEHLIYIGNYLPSTHPYFKKSPDQLLATFDPYLKKLNPTYRSSLIACHLFQTPFAQPIITKNYSRLLPPLTTPIPNLYLANMQQVYPWDRQTNYAVELGQKVADLILKNNS